MDCRKDHTLILHEFCKKKKNFRWRICLLAFLSAFLLWQHASSWISIQRCALAKDSASIMSIFFFIRIFLFKGFSLFLSIYIKFQIYVFPYL